MKISKESQQKVLAMLEKLDRDNPFKRVQVPQHLIDRLNDERTDGITTKEMAVTVQKGVEVTDEMLWEFISGDWIHDATPLDFGDLRIKQAASPSTVGFDD